MKRKLLRPALMWICWFLVGNQADSQPYQSMFSHEDFTTKWSFAWYNLNVAGIYEAFVEKDTMVHGVTYKKVVLSRSEGFGYLFREDILTGKVWFRSLNDSRPPNPMPGWLPDTTDRLAFRFDLNIGDTFDISNTGLTKGSYPDSFNVVDSVRVINGRRHIYFKGLIGSEPITIIEGVGSNLGIFWKHGSDPFLGGHEGMDVFRWNYLLCHYQNGQKTSFHNRRYNGNCNPDLHITDLDGESGLGKEITLYPQPARGTVWIGNDGTQTIRSIQIYTSQGKLVHRLSGDDITEFDTGGLPAGLYYIKLFSDRGYLVSKPLVIN